MRKSISLVLSSVLLIVCCPLLNAHQEVIVEQQGLWSDRMVQSIIKRSPEAWAMRPHKGLTEPKWAYTYGLVLKAMQQANKRTKSDKVETYIKQYVDQLIDDDGHIKDYRIWDFNIDSVNAGKLLFDLYDRYKDPRYLKAMQDLRVQLRWQPKTSDGGYWHKRYYPWQMWLDGLYMGAAYQVQYDAQFGGTESDFDQALHQFLLIKSHVEDPETGLLYHAWDESRLQTWADPATGVSKHVWLRAMGWYVMALVDALEYWPHSHPGKSQLVDVLQGVLASLKPYQHPSGLWYQIVDMPKAAGNYLETSGTAMISYATAKAVRLGYLDSGYLQMARRAFTGIVNNHISIDASGELHLGAICGSAGLGGYPHYRDGSFEYYIGEAIVPDDAHGTGPFILAALELGI